MQKKWYESKIIWFKILTAAVAIIGVLKLQFPEIVAPIAVAESIIVIVLRLMTDTGIQTS